MSSVDDDGNMFVLLDEIIDHHSLDKALTEKESLGLRQNQGQNVGIHLPKARNRYNFMEGWDNKLGQA